MNIVHLAERLIDLILPPRCPVTGAIVDTQGMISAEVWQGLRFIAAPYCSCCGHPFPHGVGDDSGAGAVLCLGCMDERPVYETARAAVAYDDGSRALILRFKHADQTHIVRSFTPWLRRAGAEMLAGADVIVPVPLHRWRLWRRRYNQAALLAQAVADDSDVRCDALVLRRVRATLPQGHEKAVSRKDNVRNAFALHPARADAIAGKVVVLVDDVYTTGATVNACAKALYAGGARAVHVLTVARVVRD